MVHPGAGKGTHGKGRSCHGQQGAEEKLPLWSTHLQGSAQGGTAPAGVPKKHQAKRFQHVPRGRGGRRIRRPVRHAERDAPPPGHVHVPRGHASQTSRLPTSLTFSKRGRSLSGSCRAMGPATCPSARRSVLRRTVRAFILMSLSASCSCCMTSGSRPCRVTAYMKQSSSFSETPRTTPAEALCLQRAQPRAEVCLQASTEHAEAPRDRRLLPWVAEAATCVSLAPCGGSSSQPQQDDCSG